MILWPILTAVLCLAYTLIGLHVGTEIAAHNRGLLLSARVSPWARGILWLPYVVLGFFLILGDLWSERNAKRPR